ncbi:MAG: phosphatidate cytidylyltransferase [Chloroflexi bacterium]|nr:phosphatidate cytidylyltransferase [Chloroflexota bacterium]
MFARRAIGAVVIVTATVLFVYLGGLPFALFIGAIAAVAARELCRLFHRSEIYPLVPAAVATALALVIDAYFASGLMPAIILLGTLAPLAWQVAVRQSPWQATMGWALTAVAAIYVGVPMSYFVLLRGLSIGQEFAGLPPGTWWVALAILGTWASDTGAYLTGMAVGKHPFMARISPKKTMEGAMGGIVWPMVVVTVMSAWITGLGPFHGIVIGALIGCAAIVGDLGESLLKRGTGVKDTGNILPGHGGMLDRIDSLIFTGPLVYYYLVWVIRP